MNAFGYIKNALYRFSRRNTVLFGSSGYGFFGQDLCLTSEPFARVIFRNAVELLTDLCNDVEFVNKAGATGATTNNMLFADFKRFFEMEAKVAMYRVFRFGFVVIHYGEDGVRMLDASEYKSQYDPETRQTHIEVTNPQASPYYVMRSDAFKEEGLSDWQILQPYLQFMDNVLNASNTSTKRLGALVVASPQTAPNAPTVGVLPESEKKKLEDETGKEYGVMNGQRSFLFFPRGMNINTVSLAGIDIKMREKFNLCALVVADRLKVPANKLAVIDAAASKALSNGSELMAGDLFLYASFERLLYGWWCVMAREIGLNVDYTIYNKPTMAKAPSVANTLK